MTQPAPALEAISVPAGLLRDEKVRITTEISAPCLKF